MNLSSEEKKAILEMRQKEGLETIKKWNPKTTNSYTTEEKCAAFDSLYDLAKEIMDFIIETGGSNKNEDHWCFEAVMCLLGDDIWDIYDKLCDQ